MLLSKARVTAFRNLRHAAVEFELGLNVVAGENNMRKTNRLDAIRVAFGSMVA